MGYTDRREVKQFQFTAWPDHGVPEHSAPFLQFIRWQEKIFVRKYKNKSFYYHITYISKSIVWSNKTDNQTANSFMFTDKAAWIIHFFNKTICPDVSTCSTPLTAGPWWPTAARAWAGQVRDNSISGLSYFSGNLTNDIFCPQVPLLSSTPCSSEWSTRKR